MKLNIFKLRLQLKVIVPSETIHISRELKQPASYSLHVEIQHLAQRTETILQLINLEIYSRSSPWQLVHMKFAYRDSRHWTLSLK